MADEVARRALVRNEQLKLAATLFNNVAAALLVTGVVAPLVAFTYGNTLPHGRFWAGYGVIWLVMAALNHHVARRQLSRMQL